MIEFKHILNEVADSILSYTSSIDPKYNVYIVYDRNSEYDIIKRYLAHLNDSIGALQVGTNNIFIDGERIEQERLNRNHLLAIEAHEIAHSKLGHSSGVDKESEDAADIMAIGILKNRGFYTAAKYLENRL